MSEHTANDSNGAGDFTPRFSLTGTWPEGYRAMKALNTAVQHSGLERPLLELVKVRASQINGCAYCIDMHTKDARAAGETEQRLYLLDAWEEAPFYSDRERAALALTESATLVHQTQIPDAVFDRARKHFSEEELAKLLFAIATINAWNRLAVGSRSPVGSYRPAGSRAGGQ